MSVGWKKPSRPAVCSGRSAAGIICWNSLATVMALTMTSLAAPGCTITPRTVTVASLAEKHS